MSRGVALPSPHMRLMPLVWAEVCVERGPVVALERIEAAAAEAQAQADRHTVAGHDEMALVYSALAADLRRDAVAFAEFHS